jgi:hypothetical protein
MNINVYSDPGHSWVKVSLKQLEKLDLLNQISQWSYLNGQFAYLEEDYDAMSYLTALQTRGIEFTIKPHHSNKASRIRTYDIFLTESIERHLRVNTPGMKLGYANDVYTLIKPLSAGSWEVVDTNGIHFKMPPSQLRRAEEMT